MPNRLIAINSKMYFFTVSSLFHVLYKKTIQLQKANKKVQAKVQAKSQQKILDKESFSKVKPVSKNAYALFSLPAFALMGVKKELLIKWAAMT